MSIKLTSDTLGLPTQKFSRDVLTDIKDMSSANLNLLIERQKLILTNKKINFPDNGKKLTQSIKNAEEELQKRLTNEHDFAKYFENLTINNSSSSMPVSGKRNFSASTTKNTLPHKEVPFLSFDEQKKAFETCFINTSNTYHNKHEMGKYREPHIEFDSDDNVNSSDCESLDSDDSNN